MKPLQGENVYLRAIEPEDLEFIYEIENDGSFWNISNTIVPYSRFVIKQYIEHSHKDIFEVKQLRLVICDLDNKAIGMIDLFDFDFKNKRAGVGILIKNETDRKKGFGREALRLLISYCKSQLALHQLYCNISEGNNASLKLFKNEGFEIVGLKKDWNLINGSLENEYMLQMLL